MSRTIYCHTHEFHPYVPSFNLSPSFFSQLTIVPDSMVGDNAGNVTRVCDGKLLQYPRQKSTFHTDGCKVRLWFMPDALLENKNDKKKYTHHSIFIKSSVRIANSKLIRMYGNVLHNHLSLSRWNQTIRIEKRSIEFMTALHWTIKWEIIVWEKYSKPIKCVIW